MHVNFAVVLCINKLRVLFFNRCDSKRVRCVFYENGFTKQLVCARRMAVMLFEVVGEFAVGARLRFLCSAGLFFLNSVNRIVIGKLVFVMLTMGGSDAFATEKRAVIVVIVLTPSFVSSNSVARGIDHNIAAQTRCFWHSI